MRCVTHTPLHAQPVPHRKETRAIKRLLDDEMCRLPEISFLLRKKAAARLPEEEL